MNRLAARISVQLDYHPCTQFAGLHLALAKGLFAKRGLDVRLLPCSPVGGLEPELVANLQRTFDREDGGSQTSTPHVAVGSVEQNVLIPAIARGVPCKAFGTIFQKSVLALGALPGTSLRSGADLKGKTFAAHNDSQMELIQTLLSHAGVPATTAQVRQVLRANKMEMLLSGKVDGVQVYGLMEGLEIESMLGKPPSVLALEDLAATIPGNFTLPLGYSQVLFATRDALGAEPARAALRTFMEVHEEGWQLCESEAEAAAEAVLEARAAAGLKEDQDRVEWQLRSLRETLPVVRGAASRIGGVAPQVWQRASRAMAAAGYAVAPVPLAASLDLDIWPETSAQQPGQTPVLGAPDWVQLEEELQEEARMRSSAFRMRAGRAPCVAVVRVAGGGDGEAEVRAAMEAAGVEVRGVAVGSAAAGVSFSEAYAAIAALGHDESVDGVLLLGPVGGGLDGAALGGCIVRDKDVAGESYEAGAARAAQAELSTQRLFQGSIYAQDAEADKGAALPLPPPWLVAGPAAPPPAATAAVEALERTGMADGLAGKRVVVVGLDRASVAALCDALAAVQAVATVYPASGPLAAAAALCEEADLVVAGAEAAGALGAGARGKAVAPTAGAVRASLCLNALRLAEARVRRRDAEARHKAMPVEGLEEGPELQAAPGWEGARCGESGAELLRRSFVCADFKGAVALAEAVRVVCERANHHPTLHINPLRQCELTGAGCEVRVELTTFVSKKVSAADVDLAQRLSALAAALQVSAHP